MKTEYPILGIPPGGDTELLLYTRAETKQEAERVAARLRNDHGCTAVRIQTFNWEAPDFAKGIA